MVISALLNRSPLVWAVLIFTNISTTALNNVRFVLIHLNTGMFKPKREFRARSVRNHVFEVNNSVRIRSQIFRGNEFWEFSVTNSWLSKIVHSGWNTYSYKIKQGKVCQSGSKTMTGRLYFKVGELRPKLHDLSKNIWPNILLGIVESCVNFALWALVLVASPVSFCCVQVGYPVSDTFWASESNPYWFVGRE